MPCPNMTSERAPLGVITAVTVNDLQLSTFNKSVGIVVDISCYGQRTLNGVNQTTCQANNSWDYPFLPKCEPIINTTADTSMSMEQMVIIGVFCGIGALLLIVLLAIIIAVCLRKRREKREKIDYKEHTWMSLFEDKDTWRFKDASIYSYPSEQTGYKPFGGYRSTYRGDWRRSAPSVDLNENPPPRTTYYGYANRSFPMELEAESPYRFVHRSSTSHMKDNDVYHGMDANRHEYKSMNYYNRQAENDGRDPFLWRPESPRSFYD